MRAFLSLTVIGSLTACGQVASTKMDAAGGGSADAAVDTLVPGDTPRDAFAGPTPQLYWAFENNVNNTGSLNNYALTTPAGIGYGTGKIGQAGMYGGGQYSYVDGMHATISMYADVTIGFWLKEPGNVPGQTLVDCWQRSTAPYGGFQLGLTNSSADLCVATSSTTYLAGSCLGFTAPSANTWHHWIIRYDGTGTGAGQGGPVEVYIDDVLVHTRANDTNNDPVFNAGSADRLYLGVPNAMIDEVKIYNQVFSLADQCTYVIRGTWTGTSCTLP